MSAELSPEDVALDPFSFFRGVASRIGGLGGNAPGHDPTYAFHTPYVAVARGPARFYLRFDDLRARRGTLVLRVHMLPDEGGAARLVNSTRIQLNRLVHLSGAVDIDFEGYRGFTFAIVGLIHDDTDARAEGLTITLDRPAGPGNEEEEPAAEDIRTTRFGIDAFRPVAQLISSEAPTLAAPVSQPCTAEQLREPVWDALSRELGQARSRDPALWPGAYALQVLGRYGLLEPEARGAVVGDAGMLGDALRRRGASLADDAGARSLDYLCVSAPQGAGQDAIAGSVGETLLRLRPGGLAVQILFLDEAGFGRSDLERLALMLISHRHEVAQLRPVATPLPDARGRVAFGLIVRRARSPI